MIIFIIFSLILLFILFSISSEDIKTMLISEYKLRIFALSGILYLVCLSLSKNNINTLDLILNNCYPVVFIFAIMYSIKFTTYKLSNINSLGMGDIKLSSFSSIWLGFETSFKSICISFLLSALYSLHGKLTNKTKSFHQYPFAPFLSISIFSSWLFTQIQAL